VLHNLHCLGRWSEESYKGRVLQPRSVSDAVRARRLRRTGLFPTLARGLLPCPAPSGTLSHFSSYLCTPTQSNQWRPRTALEGLATAKDSDDPSLANPSSHTTLHRTARHARSARVPSEGKSLSTEGVGSARYGFGRRNMAVLCIACGDRDQLDEFPRSRRCAILSAIL
jgi:hypothetical protein